MEQEPEYEELPTGKTINRQFGADGSLFQESHTYGELDIGIQFDFKAGVKVYETYFAKKRIVSRRTYEKARVAYPDMPAANGTLKDTGAELLRAAAKEQRQHKLEAKQHQPVAEHGRKSDSFCSTLMAKGRREDAVAWIQNKNHTLGERNWRSSKGLVDRLARLGCVQIYACDVDVYDDGLENTGHLVIELPPDAKVRTQILNGIGRLASEQGYSGDFDDGQRYVYVKLD
jgi:hypothetical protein